MVGIASAARAVVIGYVAANTRSIRVAAGWIMLPNHSPRQSMKLRGIHHITKVL
jgi:alkanesulfonate monooxygenase SsuD/methylene tetrahydromethanopterin reductase-like flavin-dependent oxidoreductase (luciferase family)